MSAVLTTFVSAQPAPSARITNLVFGDPRVPAWSVDPGIGSLRVAIPVATVPGELPIPVTFTMNGTFMSVAQGQDSAYANYGIYGTLGFGSIGSNPANGGLDLVLEDGRHYPSSEFATYGGASPSRGYGTSLLGAFGIWNPPGDFTSFQVSADASLAWARLPLSRLRASCLEALRSLLPTGCNPRGMTCHLLMDKDRLRVFAELGNGRSMVAYPVYWADRFGYAVTFKWTQETAHLPPGIRQLTRVEALNQRHQGVTVRYAEWADTTLPHDLLRADCVGFEGPSVLLSGCSGTAHEPPEGWRGAARAWSLYLAGMMARPTSITLGEPTTLPQPTWADCGVEAARSPVLSPSHTPVEPRGWSLAYDAGGAQLTTLTDPWQVQTRFRYEAASLFASLKTAPTLFWGVTEAVERDLGGTGNATHTRTWQRSLPRVTPAGCSQAQWTVTCRDGWSHGGAAPADRTTTYTFAGIGEGQDYRNGTLREVETTDGTSTRSTRIETLTDPATGRGGGLDGTLSLPRTVTTTTTGEGTRRTVYAYTDVTGLQVASRATQVGLMTTTGGRFADAQVETYAYNNQWSMLESRQVRQVQTTRFDLATGAPLGPGPRTTTNLWDDGGRLQLEGSFLDGGGAFRHGMSFAYNGEGKLYLEGVLHVENGASLGSPLAVTHDYDPATGLPTAWTTAYQEVPAGLGSLTRSAGNFDCANRPTLFTDERQVQTTQHFDLYGRPTEVATQGLPATTFTYPDPWTTVATQGPRTTITRRDGFGRRVSNRGWDGSSTLFDYDGHGRLAATTQVGSSGTRITRTASYDGLDRPTGQVGFDGVATQSAYTQAPDGLATVTRTCGGGTYPTTEVLDPFGQVLRTRAPNGDRTERTFDGWGHLTEVRTRTPGGAEQVRTYVFGDPLGRLTRKTEPETGTQTYSAYNALNRPTTLTEGADTSTPRSRNLVLDGLGRLRTVNATGDSGAATEVFAYGTGSQGAFLTGSLGAVAGDRVSQLFEYGPAAQGARLRQETTSQAGVTTTIGYGYSAMGDLQTLTYPDGRTVSYGFDDLGRAISVTTSLNGVDQTLVPTPAGAPFDEWGRRTSLAFQSGAADWWGTDATHSRPGTWFAFPKGGNPLAWSYTYEPASGRLTGTGEWTLQNDLLGRLAMASRNWFLAQDAEGQAFMNASNPLTTTLDHDAFGNNVGAAIQGPVPPAMNPFDLGGTLGDNHLPATTKGGGLLNAIHDPYGELTSIATSVSGPRSLDLTWDPLGRLATATTSPAGSTQRYRYAPGGLRIARQDSRDPLQTRTYAYTRSGLLLTEYAQADASHPALQARDVVYLDGRPIAELDSEGVHELHSDHLGTPRLITRGATGAAEGLQTFGPYGENLGQTGYLPLTGYTGHLQTEPNALVYMRGRFYSPAWHRFLNSDQGLDPRQPNQFAYCGGNPMARVDPSGLGFLDDLWGVLGKLFGSNSNSNNVPPALPLLDLPSGGGGGGGGGGSQPRNQQAVEPTINWAAMAAATPKGGLLLTAGNYEVSADSAGSIEWFMPLSKEPGAVVNVDGGQGEGARAGETYPVYVWNYTPHWGPIPTGIPHTFIQTPNMTKGYYPKDDYHYFSAVVTVPGEIRNDSDHPRNSTPTQTFWVDAATLGRVEQGMSWSPAFYELNNGFWNHAYNCTGWANQVLAGAGLKSGWGGVGANPWIN